MIPANTETLNLQFTLDLTGFRNDVYSPDSYDELTALDENDADYTTLTNLLDGHILFFREKDADGNYSGLIDDTFTENIQFTKDQSGELDPYPMTIYWVWPNTFEEAMLTDADLNGEQKSICNSTELLDKFAEDPDHFLYGYEVPNDATLDASYVREQKTLLSRAYNDADQEIGDEVGYLLVELTALEIR